MQIPMFPLMLLPLPGELVPLHIFEPRYKELVYDAENHNTEFGIYFNHEINADKIGALMKLESVLKRYPGGESDIMVKCKGLFNLHTLHHTFNTKLYPGGDVTFLEEEVQQSPAQGLYDLFAEYMMNRNIIRPFYAFTYNEMATQLNLDLPDRYKFLASPSDKKEIFLMTHLKFQLHIFKQEEKSKDVFHLN